ncbi:MAG: signal peptidase II [Alphaproteobacteria bacterium]|nr:signal peptidase II [Alphaproteobacteria bacterium]
MSDETTETGLAFKQRLMWLILIAGFWFIADQYHKYYMLEIYHIADKGIVEWLPFMNLVLVWNKGISYGLFQQSGYGSLILASVTGLVMVGLIIIILRTKEKMSVIYMSFFVGTALGNGYDRVFRQGVVDVFQPKFGDYTWYVFNIADVAMTFGVILLLIDVFFLSRTDVKED